MKPIYLITILVVLIISIVMANQLYYYSMQLELDACKRINIETEDTDGFIGALDNLTDRIRNYVDCLERVEDKYSWNFKYAVTI